MKCIREFNQIINMSGEPHAQARCYRLHQLLEEAFTELSGLQQSMISKETKKDGEWLIEGYARDFVMALTGKEFVFKEDV